MTDDQRADHNTMRALAPFTKLSPTERLKQCSDIVQKINDVKSIVEIKNPKKMDGYILPRPVLKYSTAT